MNPSSNFGLRNWFFPEFEGLRAAFEQLAPELQLRQLSAVTLDGGGSAAIIDQYRPDTAFVVVGGNW